MSKKQKTSCGKKEYFILGQLDLYKLHLSEVVCLFVLYCLLNILLYLP